MSTILTYFIGNHNSLLQFSKIFSSLIEPITKNNLTVKNTFESTIEICEQSPEYFMASLDVESLFTSITLYETIKICCESFYKNQELLRNISKNQF